MNLQFINVSNVLIVSSVLQVVLSGCGSKPCIRKCCGPGLALLETSVKYTCQNYEVPLSIDNIDQYEIVFEAKCLEGKVPVEFFSDSFVFSVSGELILIENETTLVKPPNDYCINYTDGKTILSAVLCLENEPDEPSNYVGKLFMRYFIRLNLEAFR